MDGTYNAASQSAGTGSAYPVGVGIETSFEANRWWAIPILGFVGKGIVLIPHAIILTVLTLVVSLLQFVLWAPVIVTGRFPEWGHALVAGTVRWHCLVYAYFFGLTDRYPPFSLAPQEGSEPYPITVTFETQAGYSRGFAIPILGFVARYILLIPHMIIVSVLGLVVGLLQLVLWAPVLFTGRYPSWGFELVGGYLRWSTRISAYFLGLTDRYPVFQME